MKIWLKYLIYSIVIFGLIFAGRVLVAQFALLFDMYMSYEFFVLSESLSALLFVIIGMLLGFERLFTERKKDGKWKFNLPKALLVGIPSLYFSLFLPLAYSSLGVIYSPTRMFLINGGKHGMDFLPVVQVMLGYTVITCFYKKKENKIQVKEDLDGDEVVWNKEQ